MTPSVGGKVYHFEWAGLDNGLSLLRDFETGTIWNHITGEAMFGPLEGERLATYNLLHTTVGAVLGSHPDIEVALSDRPIRQQEHSLFERLPVLSRMLRSTMARQDERRPQTELGLGVWSDDAQRYYPLAVLRESDGLLVDEFAGRRIVVYLDPMSYMPASWYTDAETALWDEESIRLSDGHVIRDGGVFDQDGERLDAERPQQLFTRWYGFALTFPATTIYEP